MTLYPYEIKEMIWRKRRRAIVTLVLAFALIGWQIGFALFFGLALSVSGTHRINPCKTHSGCHYLEWGWFFVFTSVEVVLVLGAVVGYIVAQRTGLSFWMLWRVAIVVGFLITLSYPFLIGASGGHFFRGIPYIF